ncbi:MULTISPECIES: DoxX family protein [Nocardia]|uniref:DoxX family protein n=1 Tax=Nocardia TaxID=1817 RepID=UPI000D69D66E|nr:MULTISPECIES: DoxX family protein [Nocardia]
MDIALTALSITTAVALTGSATATLARTPALVAIVAAVGFPEHRMWLLAVLKLAAAVGLVAGLAYRPLGIAAAVGLVAYFCAAVWMHLRARQYDLAGPILFLALSGATLALSVYAAA